MENGMTSNSMPRYEAFSCIQGYGTLFLNQPIIRREQFFVFFPEGCRDFFSVDLVAPGTRLHDMDLRAGFDQAINFHFPPYPKAECIQVCMATLPVCK